MLRLKEQNTLRLQQLIKFDPERDKKLREIEKWFISQINPKDFEKLEIKMELDFEKLCHLLNDYTNVNVKKMSVKEFYSLLEVVDKKKPKSMFI